MNDNDKATIADALCHQVLSRLVDRLHDGISLGTVLSEALDDALQTATEDDQIAVLWRYGDCDLSEPRPDLSQGWSRVRGQLAYNALYVAVVGACADAGIDLNAEPETDEDEEAEADATEREDDFPSDGPDTDGRLG